MFSTGPLRQAVFTMALAKRRLRWRLAFTRTSARRVAEAHRVASADTLAKATLANPLPGDLGRRIGTGRHATARIARADLGTAILAAEIQDRQCPKSTSDCPNVTSQCSVVDIYANGRALFSRRRNPSSDVESISLYGPIGSYGCAP
jgi:hypothetical protein